MKREQIIKLAEDFLLSKNIPTHKLISQVYGHGEISLTGLLAQFVLSLHQEEQEGNAEKWLREETFLIDDHVEDYQGCENVTIPSMKASVLIEMLEQYAASRIAEGEKQPMNAEEFCKIHSAYCGEQIDNIKQLTFQHFTGDELFEFCQFVVEQYAKTNKSK